MDIKRTRRKLNVMQILLILSLMQNTQSKSLSLIEEPQQIILKADTLQSYHVSELQNVDIICPFNQPIWYHNEQYLNTNRTFKIKAISLEKSGTYSCLSQLASKSGDLIKWANVSLNVCSNFTKDEPCQITEIKPLKLKEDFNKKPTQLPQRKEAEVVFSSAEVDNLEEHLNTPPKFKSQQLYNTTQKYSGGTAIFNCNAYSHIAANISWTFNNRSLDLYSSKYKIKKWAISVQDLQSQDSGEYACTICNLYGCIYRASILNVLERESSPPIIREGSVINQTIMADENVKFECDVISALEPHIVWYHHTDLLNLTEDHAFDSSYNPHALKLLTRPDEPYILRLGSVQEEDQGWYSCIAANSLGEAVASYYLSIMTADTFLNDTLEPEEELKNVAVTVTSVEFNTFNLEQNDNDESSDHDTDSKNSDIEEEKAPQFKNLNKLERNMHKPAGSSIQLVCAANGHPTPNITWTRNNTEIERHIGKVTYKKWSIQMDDAITKDSGIYKCTVCNALGCIEHSTKVIVSDRLRSRPIISDKFPQNQTVLTNSSTYLECRVVSDLEPYIVWLKYSKRNESIDKLEKVVPNFSNDQSMLSKDVVILERDQDKPNILNFTKVSHDDEGWYTCVAASSLGQTVASAYLKVVDKLPQRDGLQRGHPITITAVAIVVVLLFLLGTIFVIYVMRNLKHEKLLKQRIETVHQWTKKVIIYKPPPSESGSCDLQMPVIKIEKQRTTFTTNSNSDANQGFNEYEFPLDSNWEIARSQLSLGSTLGEGAFGRVVMAQGSNLPRVSANGSAGTIVAVKMVKEEHTDADMASLVREMEVMKMIGKHINIINLLGCCSQNGPLWVIVEFAPHGNLKDFLKKNRPLSNWGSCSLKRNSEYLDDKTHLTEKHLISFAFQIARGMEYLASRRCIHRDLAARNVLVSDDYIMKIADFGLARDIQDTDYYRKNTNGRLPIKWMAPESLQEKFYDSQSDVWSYGVLLWEIMTYGEQPYPNIMSAEELYSYLITGQRMEKPARCSLNIYMLMRQCWHFDSTARPTFTEIVENLDKILQLTSTTSNEEYLDLSMPMLETPPSSSDEDSDAETFRENSLRYQYTYKFN
ncbi:fibroblast growth factor receptor homolog 1 [Calliphora vicina]|uniref:fibroblast growth factor receptor homolog 1 n=1 Tax=Calliphora vicina TaxID=7373 RepID=UPI00325B663B